APEARDQRVGVARDLEVLLGRVGVGLDDLGSDPVEPLSLERVGLVAEVVARSAGLLHHHLELAVRRHTGSCVVRLTRDWPPLSPPATRARRAGPHWPPASSTK